eukprot:1162042-Pelagomonas_calceolata.AAC.1
MNHPAQSSVAYKHAQALFQITSPWVSLLSLHKTFIHTCNSQGCVIRGIGGYRPRIFVLGAHLSRMHADLEGHFLGKEGFAWQGKAVGYAEAGPVQWKEGGPDAITGAITDAQGVPGQLLTPRKAMAGG